MKFLITGASGFIGRRLSTALLDKYGNGNNEFIFIVNQRDLNYLKQKHSSKIEVHKGDIRNINHIKNCFNNVDVVIHMAARVDYSSIDKQSYYDVNATGTKNIFELSLKNNIKKVIYLSSAVIYHPTHNEYADENTVVSNHVTHYTKSKYRAYRYIEKFCNLGLNIVTILPTSVFGFKSPLFDPFVRQCLKSKFVILPKDRCRLSIVLVDDVVKFILSCVDSKIYNNEYILSDIDMSLRALAGQISIKSGRRIKILLLPNVFFQFILFAINPVLSIFKIRLFNNYEMFKFVNGNFLAKSSRAKDQLNWRPSDFDKSLERIIKQYIEYLK